MGKGRNWRLFCCMCSTELPYQRVMEQSVERGQMRYIEEEVALVCAPCQEKLPNARPAELRDPDPRGQLLENGGRYVAEPGAEPRREEAPWPPRRGW